MLSLRPTNRLPLIALLALAGALGLALSAWRGSTAATQPATERLQAAAEQRPVNKTDQLIWDYQERVRRQPEDTSAYATLGAAYVQRARETGDPTYYGKAEASFSEALRRDPQHVEALIGTGTLALARHQFREALTIGEQARALNPSIPRIYGLIGDAQVELGMYDQALQSVQTMVDMRPDLSSYSRVSYLRELHGDLSGAIEAMESAVSAGGPNAENTVWVRLQLGHLYFNSGDLKQAEQQYQQTLAQLPGYVHGLASVARVRAVQGRYDEAIGLYQRAVEQMPLPEFVIALGETQEAAGRSADAAKQYALVRAMQQLLAANGVETDLELALFEADHGQNPQAALTLAQAAYDRRPNIRAADTLAWALLKAGRPADAGRYADEALRLGTQDSLLLYHAGVIAQANGDSAAARGHLEQALALNPAFSPLYGPRARQALAELGTP